MKLELDRTILWEDCTFCLGTGYTHVEYVMVSNEICGVCRGNKEIPTPFGKDLIEFIYTVKEIREREI